MFLQECGLLRPNGMVMITSDRKSRSRCVKEERIVFKVSTPTGLVSPSSNDKGKISWLQARGKRERSHKNGNTSLRRRDGKISDRVASEVEERYIELY